MGGAVTTAQGDGDLEDSSVPRQEGENETEAVCESPCMFDGETYSCRERVQWLVRERGSTIAAAVDILSNECDGQCMCSPTEFPELQCDSPCMFDSETHSCRDRVQWLVRERGSTVAAALDTVSQECGGQCICGAADFEAPSTEAPSTEAPTRRCCGDQCSPDSPEYDPDTEQCCGEGTFVFRPTVCSKESGCCPSGYSRSPQCFDASSEQCCGWDPQTEGALVCGLDVACPSFEGYSTACPSLSASASLRGAATGGEQLLP